MTLEEATAFLSFENKNPMPHVWLDLGCGAGLFTLALTCRLPGGSRIIAIDKDKNALKQLPASANKVLIETRVLDFMNDTLDIANVDGVLMANSLHYVKDKENFLNSLHALLKPNAVFLIVEYDTPVANQWVPYPLGIDAAKTLFKNLGYVNFHLLNKKRSVYGAHSMYAMMIE